MFYGTDHEEEGFQRMGAYQYGSIVRTEDADDRSAFTVYLSINAAHVSLYDASIGKSVSDLPFGGDPEPFKDSTGDQVAPVSTRASMSRVAHRLVQLV